MTTACSFLLQSLSYPSQVYDNVVADSVAAGPSTAAASGDQCELALSDGVDLHVTRFTPESPDFNPSTDVK